MISDDVFCSRADDLVVTSNRIENVMNTLLPDLEKRLSLRIETPLILLPALFQLSVKNLFLELRTHFRERGQPPVPEDSLNDLAELGEAGRVLALVGDAALNLAVLPYVWDSEIGNVGRVSQRRAEYVSNMHLAAVCGQWKLYDYRIHFDPPTVEKSEIDHIKATLAEAIFGIVFLFYGLEAVNKAIPLLRSG